MAAPTAATMQVAPASPPTHELVEPEWAIRDDSGAIQQRHPRASYRVGRSACIIKDLVRRRLCARSRTRGCWHRLRFGVHGISDKVHHFWNDLAVPPLGYGRRLHLPAVFATGSLHPRARCDRPTWTAQASHDIAGSASMRTRGASDGATCADRSRR